MHAVNECPDFKNVAASMEYGLDGALNQQTNQTQCHTTYVRSYNIATVQGGAPQTRRMLQQPSAATDMPRAAPRPWRH